MWGRLKEGLVIYLNCAALALDSCTAGTPRALRSSSVTPLHQSDNGYVSEFDGFERLAAGQST